MFAFVTDADNISFSQMMAPIHAKRPVTSISAWSVQHVRSDRVGCNTSFGSGRVRIKMKMSSFVIVAKHFYHLTNFTLCTISVMNAISMFAIIASEEPGYNEIHKY